MTRVLTSRDGDFTSHFVKVNETQADKTTTTLKYMIIGDHEENSTGKNKGQLSLEHIFGFCMRFRKITKSLWFHLTIKTAELQDSISTTYADVTNITTFSLFFIATRSIPSAETQAKFNESIRNYYTSALQSW